MDSLTDWHEMASTTKLLLPEMALVATNLLFCGVAILFSSPFSHIREMMNQMSDLKENVERLPKAGDSLD